jgi:uncharacterized protein (DUF983 family)
MKEESLMSKRGKRWLAILRQRCPNCLEGRVFHGLTAMYEHCPQCGHKFAREAGYFLGAMYASYFMAIPLLSLLALLIHWLILPDWRLENTVLVAILPFLLIVPLVFRYSRILWMHIDPPMEEPAPRS